MADYDIMTFLEYYADRSSVINPITSKRAPSGQWQNFYPISQQLSVDVDASGFYSYLAFDADGFGSTEAASINDLSINLAATGQIVDITDAAMGSDNLIIASLYIQDAGQDAFDAGSAQLINRYIGSIEDATLSDQQATWTVNPAINKLRSQVPSRKISTAMLGRFYGR